MSEVVRTMVTGDQLYGVIAKAIEPHYACRMNPLLMALVPMCLLMD